MHTLNLGILAHVDAGKTTLSERLLFATGAINAMGSVDAGTTQTDSLALERQRGITIKAAVASFVYNDVHVNLIDTPGHPDFIAEVERALSVLDGAVLVISAVEGVQAQSRVLMGALRRLRIPTLLFINKIDRMGAQHELLTKNIRERLAPGAILMGRTENLGNNTACFLPFPLDAEALVTQVLEHAADVDEALLQRFVTNNFRMAQQEVQSILALHTRSGHLTPVYLGSAVTGTGVDHLLAGIISLLPCSGADLAAPLSARIFKIERGSALEKIAYARVFTGRLLTRKPLRLLSGARRAEGRVTAMRVFANGHSTNVDQIHAGQVAQLWGLTDAQIGDSIRDASDHAVAEVNVHSFAPPSLEAVVRAKEAAQTIAMQAALTLLAEQDPLINLRRDNTRPGEALISLYGEVQKEVIQQTLANDFAVAVEFHETTVLCVERPIGVGAAVKGPPYPFIAEVGVRIEPGEINSGVVVRLEIQYGYLPIGFHRAVEEGIRSTLTQGLCGWPVTDCVVWVTHAIRFRDWGTSTPADHRHLAPMVVMKALQQAGTQVCEPIYHFSLTAPTDSLSLVLPALARWRAIAEPPTVQGRFCNMLGSIPARQVHGLQISLPALTHGEGILETRFDHYRPVSGKAPQRVRLGPNPLDHKEYLRSFAASS